MERETEEEYQKRILKKEARIVQKEQGIKYTQALRIVKERRAQEDQALWVDDS